MNKDIKSILLVDDEEEQLKLYAKLLNEKIDAKITTTRYPSQAIKFAKQYFYDICIIDITMNFQGNPFGGIDLYNVLRSRYGGHSLLAYSQYVSDQLLQRYQCGFNFIEKKADTLKFVIEIEAALINLRKQQKCFIAMPFNKKYNSVYNEIKRAVHKAKYIPVRLDHLPFTSSIYERMLREIQESKIIVFVASDKNPNAFFECGYAVAIEKEVITLTDSHKNLPFDIRDKNSISYGNSPNKLGGLLLKRISSLCQSK